MTIFTASVPIVSLYLPSPYVLPLTFPVYKNSFLYPEDGDGMLLRNTPLHVADQSRL